MKIGLMGGTFNPVHMAHLRIAEEARDICGLDRVLFIPAADPPHKPLAGDVSFSHRYEMVRIAISGNPFFSISDIEGKRGGKSYSIDTIQAFKDLYPDDTLFFIIGGDSFLDIGIWHRYADIFRQCSLIVAERPGSIIADPIESLPVAIRGEFHYTSASRTIEHDSGNTTQLFSGCGIDLSSRSIREMLKQGRSVKYLLDPRVEQYIKEKGIYT